MSGPAVGDGTNYDIQYSPGSALPPWGTGHYVEVFNYWSYGYRPGPATINGISANMAGSGVNNAAQVGDRLFVAISTEGFTDRIVYMQVVGVGAGSVIADTWVWNKA
jgi:hypothetical protein